MSQNQLANPMHESRGSQSPSYGAFFTNANVVNINQGTFTIVHGNMNVYSSEQPSHVRTNVESITTRKLTIFKWNKYRWVDFDQRTLRHLSTSSTGIVTMEAEPMTLTSRVEIYRIHWYTGGDKKDIFDNHLEFAKSPLARRPDISQFLGTSIDHEDDDRFIVLSGGPLSLSNVFIGSCADLEIIKIASDIFSAIPFTVLLWSWSIFWDLPMFSPGYSLLVDIVLLESYSLLASSQGASKRVIYNH
ncbi:hypothetical protein BYT27DRAFT_7198785 [Phlegmacium glaucopus]|nr:hypothetical protein BYT27DRAFT_7198785 [Phlegmacium glaucopus]